RVLWKWLEHFAQPFFYEGIKLLDANDRRVLNFPLSAIFQQIVINFSRTKNNALRLVDRTSFWRAKDLFEPAMNEFLGGRGSKRGAKQTLRLHYDQWLDEVALHLAPQHMKILCGSSEIADLDVIFGAGLQKALQSSTGVLRPLAFVAMREQKHDPTWLLPFRFCCDDELIYDRLCSIDTIAELSFP